MGIWTNEDGLEVRFGIDRATSAPTGGTSAEEKIHVFDIADATEIASVDGDAADGDAAVIPAGAIIKDAYLVVDTAFTSGGSATLDIGLKTLDGGTVDTDVVDAAIALADIDAVDDVIACDGSVIGTRLAEDRAITISYNTAAFTAGAAKLVVKYVVA